MVTFSDIMAARKALDGYVYETPILASNALRIKTGHETVILKCENLQRTGSYHLRGATYRVIRAKEEDLGISHFVTYSTGNSGAALSCAASNFQSKGHIVVPNTASELITRSICHYGGEYRTCPPTLEGRETAVQEWVEQLQHVKGKQRQQTLFVHPYDDAHIITGHGTAGIEMMLQTDCSLDCVVVPVGGGALLAGVAMAVKGMKPHVGVFAAECVELGQPYEAFKRGELMPKKKEKEEPQLTKSDNGGSPARKLRTPLTKRADDIVQHYVDGVIEVSVEQIRYAFRYVYERCKLVIDTNAATAVAAVLACSPQLQRYRRVGIILSGGNVDLNDIPRLAVARL